MAARDRGGWPRAMGWCGLLGVLASGLAAGTAVAQPGSSDGISYAKQSTFLIPFQIEDRRVQSVLLHVSDDFGNTYRHVATAGPNDRSFRFQAPKDGWYWFSVQTVDAENRHAPPNVKLAQPALKVCVDTQPPRVTLRSAQLRDAAAGVEWELADENLDLSSLRVKYRIAGGREWLPLQVQELAQGRHGWNPAANAQLEVHLEVSDKAGNQAETTVTITPGPARAGGAPAAGAAAADTARLGNVLMVNKRRIQLNFKIEDEGPSGVSGVDIWTTTDTTNWQRYKRETNKTPPYVVEVAREGRYGFTLIAHSGVGLSEPPPSPGDQPQIWVEVDETKPVVRLLRVDVGRGADSGNLTINWTASDRYLAATPISISYSAAATGPWTSIAQSLPNDGRYVWRMGEGIPYQFYVRVEAVDRAGNVGQDDTSQPVKVDLALPKARVIHVEAAQAGTNPDSVPPRMPPETQPARGAQDVPKPRDNPAPTPTIPSPPPR